MAEAQFSRQKNRWSTFRYSIIMGIWMGWSLIYKQSSAISLFHTKLLIWASYWTKTVTILQGWVSDEWESAGVLMDTRKRQKGQVCASCEWRQCRVDSPELSVCERASEYSRILPGKGDVDDIFGKQTTVVVQTLTKKGGENTTKNKQGRKTRKRKSYCLRKDLHKLPWIKKKIWNLHI